MSAQPIAYLHTLLFAFAAAGSGLSVDWIARPEPTGNVASRPAAAAVDDSGNLITAASLDDGRFMLVKFAPDSKVLWTRLVELSPPTLAKYPAIAVDAVGSLHVAGALESGTDADIRVLKFDPAGSLLWDRVIEFEGRNLDCAVALRPGGGLVVAGSFVAESSVTRLTVAYDTAGNEIWTAAQDFDPGWSTPELAVDATGSVFLAGRPATKYGPEGTLHWAIDVPGIDEIVAVVADDTGGAVFAGYGPGQASYRDLIVVRLDAGGAEAWRTAYDGPRNGPDAAVAMSRDAAGNFLVAGVSRVESDDIVTIKIASNGSLLWTRRFDGPERQTDEPVSIVTDDDGNVFVGGAVRSDISQDLVLLSYTSAGSLRWASTFDGGGSGFEIPLQVIVDESRGIELVGSSEGPERFPELTVVRFGDDGSTLSVVRAPEVEVPDQPAAGRKPISTDLDGSYVVGTRHGEGGSWILTTRVSNSGEVLWTRSDRLGPRAFGTGYAVTSDTDGNAVVLGASGPAALQSAVLLVKYSAAGDRIWSSKFDGGPDFAATAHVLSQDADGRIHVAGSVKSAENGFDVLTVSFSSSGALRWHRTYSGPGSRSDSAVAIEADSIGNVYVAARVSSESDADATVLKYDTSGNLVWSRAWVRPGGDDQPTALHLVGDDRLYVAGTSDSTGLDSNVFLWSLDSDGNDHWIAMATPWPGNELARDLEVDTDGSAYVTATAFGTTESATYLVTKFDPDGNQLWFTAWDAGPVEPAPIADLSLREGEDPLLVGTAWNGNETDLLILRLEPALGTPSASLFDAGSHRDDRARGIARDPTGRLLIAGYTEDPPRSRDTVLMRLEVLEPVFSDGFESGDTAAWSDASPLDL